MLQFFSASSGIVNSRRAITECLEVALEGEPNLDCDLIIIYAAIGHNFKELLSEAKRLAPSARIVGCTGGGVIGREGPNETLKALAIMAIKGTKVEFAVVRCESMVGKDPYEVTAGMARDLKNKNPSINMIHFLPSALDIWPADRAILGIESVFGKDIPVFGAASMDNMKFVSNFQFLDDQIFERGAIMLGLADPTLGIVSQTTHGLSIQEGRSFKVTRAESSCVYELNGQPAWRVFTDSLGVPESTNHMEAAVLALFAVLIPEEFRKDYGSKYKCLGIMGKNEDNSIILPSIIEEGSILFIAKRDEKTMFDGVDQMSKRLTELLKGKEILAVFHADCSIRGRFSFNRFLKDEIINRIQYPICKNESIPWLGLYSGGEFAMIGQQNHILQVTSTLSVLYRQKN